MILWSQCLISETVSNKIVIIFEEIINQKYYMMFELSGGDHVVMIM